jgi:hypothetical protein
MKLDFQCVTTHSKSSFMTSWPGPCSWIVMLLTPVWQLRHLVLYPAAL